MQRLTPDRRALEYYETQLEQLTAEGCAQVFRETVSGAEPDRPELARALPPLAPDPVAPERHSSR